MKTKSSLIILFIVVLIVSFGVWRLKNIQKYSNLTNPPRFLSKFNDSKNFASIEGKIEEVENSVLPNNPATTIVMITNNGEMILLLNLEQVNILRFGNVGKLLKLKGFWYRNLPFRGKIYRAFWIEEVG